MVKPYYLSLQLTWTGVSILLVRYITISACDFPAAYHELKIQALALSGPYSNGNENLWGITCHLSWRVLRTVRIQLYQLPGWHIRSTARLPRYYVSCSVSRPLSYGTGLLINARCDHVSWPTHFYWWGWLYCWCHGRSEFCSYNKSF